MPLNTKQEARYAEILACAARLFEDHGVAAVAIDEIAREANIAKGTFYLYFRSKSDLLARLAEALVARMAERAEAASLLMDDPADRFVAAVSALRLVENDAPCLSEALHHPGNLELHERMNVAFVRQIAPVLARTVEAGNKTGAFCVADPLPTVEFLVAGQAFLLGNARFNWTPSEYADRLKAALVLIERALGAPPGSLAARLAAALDPPCGAPVSPG